MATYTSHNGCHNLVTLLPYKDWLTKNLENSAFNFLVKVADVDLWRRLRSASTPATFVPTTRLSTVDDRAFHVAAAAAQTWNSLPPDVTSSTSLPAFKRQLETVQFIEATPETLLAHDNLFRCGTRVTLSSFSALSFQFFSQPSIYYIDGC